MREIITLICSALFIATSFSGNAQEKMVNYTLDANEQIIGCKIVALKKSGDVGKVESIVGSKLNLHIHSENVYRVTINDEKVFYLQYESQRGFAEVDGIKITSQNELDSWAISSDEAVESDPGMKYRIQIGAFSSDVSINSFRELGQVYTEEIDGGITRYMIGSFDSQVDADKAEAAIKEMGYTNAFKVVCYNGKRIQFQEAKAIQEQQPTNLTYNQ